MCRCGFLGFFSGSVFRAAPLGGVKQNLVSCIRCCVVVEDRLCSVSIVSRRLSCHFCFLLFFYFVVLFLFVFFFLSINFNRNGVFLFLDFSIFQLPSTNLIKRDKVKARSVAGRRIIRSRHRPTFQIEHTVLLLVYRISTSSR